MSATKATLRSRYWKEYFSLIQFCFSCGGSLKKLYVRAEKKRRHVCIKCEAITYLNPKVVAGLIPVLPDGRIILLQREIAPARGKWSYPAGYQELGESVEDAAVRETWEEILTKVRVTSLLGIYSYADAGVVTIVYRGEVLKGQIPKPGAESQAVKIFKPNEIPWKELAFRSTTDALRDWLKKV